MHGRTENLIQKAGRKTRIQKGHLNTETKANYLFNSLFIAHELPEVHLQVVHIHLDLLQSELTQCL